MLGLWASKHTTQELSEAVKRQLVAAQMAKDPNGRLGARVVKQRVFEDTGLHLTRCALACFSLVVGHCEA